MTTPKETIWELDPHTVAKHEILRRYLQAWFPILNSCREKIVYIDGFSGPGRYKGNEQGSPIIALDVAKTHRSALTSEIVFWFIDEQPDRVQNLQEELNLLKLPTHFKVFAECGKFHEVLLKVLDSLEENNGQLAPTFSFIDPFGFSGIPFNLIERLLKQPRSEALITFMVDAINRFLKHPSEEIVHHIRDAFGTDAALQIAHGGGNRVEALRTLYQSQLQKAARFVRFFEMRDVRNRPQYYLFFATNNELGHIKMKEAMWHVDPNFREKAR